MASNITTTIATTTTKLVKEIAKTVKVRTRSITLNCGLGQFSLFSLQPKKSKDVQQEDVEEEGPDDGSKSATVVLVVVEVCCVVILVFVLALRNGKKQVAFCFSFIDFC